MEVKMTSLRRRASVIAAMACGLWSFGANAEVLLRVDAQPVSDPIEVFVSVTNSTGVPVTGLSKADFTVRVDNTPVETFNFSTPASGGNKVSVVLAMDMSQTVQSAALEAMQNAVIQFIDSMKVGDYAAIVKFNNTNAQRASVVQPFTAIDGGSGTVQLKSAVMAPYPGSGSNILDALTLSINTLKTPSVTLPGGPKAVVLVSDGRDNSSTNSFESIVANANGAGISLFTIGVGDLTVTGGRLLNDLAGATGGKYFPAPNNNQIAGAYMQISNQLNSEYAISFTSSITDCNSHTVSVTVTGQGSGQSSFQRCTSTTPPPPPPPTGGGGGGGGGGGATGLVELALGLALLGFAGRRRRLRVGG